MCKFHDPSIIASRDTEGGSEEPPQSQIDQKLGIGQVTKSLRQNWSHWLVYHEGMFSFWCKKHKTENQKKKSKAFNETPSVYWKSARQDHLSTQPHKDAV